MSSIRTEPTALDSNEFVFGIRGDPNYPESERLLRRISKLSLFVPRQIVEEVHRNLLKAELNSFYDALATARELMWAFDNPSDDLIRDFEAKGAKKGDAVIAAHLQQAGIE